VQVQKLERRVDEVELEVGTATWRCTAHRTRKDREDLAEVRRDEADEVNEVGWRNVEGGR